MLPLLHSGAKSAGASFPYTAARYGATAIRRSELCLHSRVAASLDVTPSQPAALAAHTIFGLRARLHWLRLSFGRKCGCRCFVGRILVRAAQLMLWSKVLQEYKANLYCVVAAGT